jgi:hypothetical protein
MPETTETPSICRTAAHVAPSKHSAGQSHRSGHESRQASAAVVSSVTKSALPRV